MRVCVSVRQIAIKMHVFCACVCVYSIACGCRFASIAALQRICMQACVCVCGCGGEGHGVGLRGSDSVCVSAPRVQIPAKPH